MKIYFFKFPLGASLGGAEFHSLQLAEYFQRQGHEVQLFSSDRRLFRLFEQRRLPRRRLFVGYEPTSKPALLLWPLTYFLAKRKFLKILAAVPNGSVFLFQSLTEKLILTGPALKHGVKIFWLEHKIPGRWLWQNPLKFWYLKLSRLVQLVTVSNFAKQEFIKLGVPAKNIQIIYPGIKTGGLERPPFTRSYTIGLLSRLEPEKGILDFLQILGPYLKKRPNWQVLVAGTGSQNSQIQKLITETALTNQVRLFGFVSSLDDFFSQIAVLVYPSLVPESFGLSIAQAQGRGIPVVASSRGALSESVTHQKTGFLVEPGSPGQWVAYLEKLTNPKIYQEMSAQARLAAVNFAEEKMFTAFHKLFFPAKIGKSLASPLGGRQSD